jgi:hypothetical protein
MFIIYSGGAWLLSLIRIKSDLHLWSSKMLVDLLTRKSAFMAKRRSTDDQSRSRPIGAVSNWLGRVKRRRRTACAD